MCGPFQKSAALTKGANVWYLKRAAMLVSFASIIFSGIAKASFSGAFFANTPSLGARNVPFGYSSTDCTISGWRSK